MEIFNNIPQRMPKSLRDLRDANVYFYSIEPSDLIEIEQLRQNGIKIQGIIRHHVAFGDTFSRIIKNSIKNVINANEYSRYRDIPVLSIRLLHSIGRGNVLVCTMAGIYQNRLSFLLDCEAFSRIYILNGTGFLLGNGYEFIKHEKLIYIDDYFFTSNKRGLDYSFWKKNEQLFMRTLDWLEDEKSKNTMMLYLKGHIENCEFPLVEVCNKEDIDNQYFDDSIIEFGDNEVFVDCGAYTGDTLKVFDIKNKRHYKYYAMEPDSRRHRQLKKSIKQAHGEVVLVNKGAWDTKTTLFFSKKNECGEIVSNELKAEFRREYDAINVDSIDNVVKSNEKITFIKMDIEGAEMMALQGAKETIKRCHPSLAICVYHKKEDLIEIPTYIKSLNTNYKLYLRAYNFYLSELVLYAVDKSEYCEVKHEE